MNHCAKCVSQRSFRRKLEIPQFRFGLDCSHVMPSCPSRCTRSWKLSAINRRQVSVDCWPYLTASTIITDRRRPLVYGTRRRLTCRGEYFSKSIVRKNRKKCLLEIPKLPVNTAQDRPTESSIPKMSRIHSAVLTQHRPVTRHPDTGDSKYPH